MSIYPGSSISIINSDCLEMTGVLKVGSSIIISEFIKVVKSNIVISEFIKIVKTTNIARNEVSSLC